MNVDDFTLLGASVLWIALFAVVLWAGTPRRDE
jgi:hypothetical protein